MVNRAGSDSFSHRKSLSSLVLCSRGAAVGGRRSEMEGQAMEFANSRAEAKAARSAGVCARANNSLARATLTATCLMTWTTVCVVYVKLHRKG